MMKINNSLLICAALFFNNAMVQAQDERILDIGHNAVIRSEITRMENAFSSMKLSSAGPDTLYLPFFDDFSVKTVWPSADRWTDSMAFINYNFPINPPTLGVATFDGLDVKGNPYDNSNANAQGLCDELTSKPINLYNDINGLTYNTSDSIFLIFYYQRRGRGDNPESSDSLTLNFFDPLAQQWVPVWSAFGSTAGDTVFNKVKISINDVNFRQNGFRFRFRNYGSKTGMLDLWHVDYVSLNKFLPPDYEFQRDYAFVYEGTSLLNTYSAIPWEHYSFLSLSQQQAFIKSTADLTLRNNNDPNPFPIKVAGTHYDIYNNSTQIVGGGGLNNIVIPLDQNLVPPASILPNTYFQDPTLGDQAIFTIVYDIGQTAGTQVDDFPVNDTLRYVQNFHDYYSYDDGTAELGYGINGVGASLAYKFDIIKPDTLRGVSMFFAQLGLSVTNQIFRIAVWSGGASGPVGPPVYQKFNLTPNYTDSLNGFFTYLTDPVYLPAGTWYFGFIQNNAVLLNLGLDVNTPADPSRKYINTSGSWTNSQLPGMWMIRPVLSETPLYTGIDQPGPEQLTFSVYPVPASQQIHIVFDQPGAERYSMNITDLSGRTVYETGKFSTEIDVSALSPGMYILHISDPVSGHHLSNKIVISEN